MLPQHSDENGLKRPLMAPRRGSMAAGAGGGSNGIRKTSKAHPVTELLLKRRRSRCWRCCEPFCYACMALVAMGGVIVCASLLLTVFPQPLQQLQVIANRFSHFACDLYKTAYSVQMF